MCNDNEKKPHVHAELIKAWADGAVIEYYKDGKWCRPMLGPSWSEGTKYRIKPENYKLYAGVFVEKANSLNTATGSEFKNKSDIVYGFAWKLVAIQCFEYTADNVLVAVTMESCL